MPDSARNWSLDVPARTIVKLVAAAALIWVWLQLWELVLLFLVAAVLAVALDPRLAGWHVAACLAD